MIELRTLGQFRILSEAKRTPIRIGKGAAVLVYLASAKRSLIGREQLTSLLWPKSDSSRARHSLSQAIYYLRQRLPNLPIITDGDLIGLEKTGIRVDVAEFCSALNEDRVEDALELYAGDFLEGFWLDGAPAFEKWQDTKRQQLQRLLTRALHDHMAKAEENGNWHNAEKFARSIIEQKAFSESAWRILLIAMAASGDRNGALAEYEKLYARSQAELDHPPSPELIAVANTIAQSVESKTITHNELDPDPSRTPFIGRESEFQQIRMYWEAVKAGHGRTLFISGEAGIGKTRLCHHFLNLSVLTNARILRGRCYAAESKLPYGAVAEALAEGILYEDLSEMTPAWVSAFGSLVPELMPEKVPDKGLVQGEGARRRLFESVARVLNYVSQQQPVILFLDDFHWADESTTEIVHYLGRRLRQFPVLILLALRSEDVAANSRVAKLLRDSATEEHFPEIHLKPLPESTAAQLIEAYKNTGKLELPEYATGQIIRQTAGRPFFILEILRALEKNEITLTERLDTAAGIQATTLLPSSVEALLSTRVTEISDNARRVMTVLAVLGKKSDPELVRRVGRFSNEAFLPGIDELADRGIIYDAGSTLTFTHDLIREAAYRSLSTTHQRTLHSRAAEVLQQLKPKQPGIVAVHYDRAGKPDHAFDFCLRAANAAEKVHAHSEAEFFLRMGLNNSTGGRDHYSVELKLAELLYRLWRFDEADGHYSNIAAYYDSVDNKSGVLKVHSRRLSIAFKKGAMPPHVLADQINQSIDVAEKSSEVDVLVQLLFSLSSLAHVSGDQDLARHSASKLKKVSDIQGDTYPGIRALTQAAKLFGLWHDLTFALDLADLAVTKAKALANDEATVAAWTARASIHWQIGQLSLAIKDVDYAHKKAKKAALFPQIPELRTIRGIAFLEQGLYSKAQDELEESLHLAEAAEVINEIIIAHSNLVLLHYDLSQFDKVEQIANKNLLIIEDTQWFAAVVATSMLGLCALAKGNVRAAKQHRREIDERAAGRDTWIVDCSYVEMFIARISETMGESEKAIERLGQAIAAYENRDVLCRSRMRLERARLRIDLDPTAAREEAEDVRRQAAVWGARPLVDKADRVLDRLALHAREGR